MVVLSYHVLVFKFFVLLAPYVWLFFVVLFLLLFFVVVVFFCFVLFFFFQIFS